MNQDKPEENFFFKELAFRLHQEGIEHGSLGGDHQPILIDGCEVGFVTPEGEVLLRQSYKNAMDAREVYHRVCEVAEEVHEYMMLMSQAPLLKAESLQMPYRMLADFNGFVLGGMESPRGVQFTTWQWTYDKTALTLGHYWNNRYDAAKQDFALRSSLLDEHRLFNNEQLTEIYRCVMVALESDLDFTYEQGRIIAGVRQQVLRLAPALAEQSQPDQGQKTQTPLEPSM